MSLASLLLWAEAYFGLCHGARLAGDPERGRRHRAGDKEEECVGPYRMLKASMVWSSMLPLPSAIVQALRPAERDPNEEREIVRREVHIKGKGAYEAMLSA